MLVEQHATQLYRLAAGIVGASDAYDITQDTFTAAWRQLPEAPRPRTVSAVAQPDLREPMPEAPPRPTARCADLA